MSSTEIDDFKNARVFSIAYGIVHYSDFFGTNHWTKFCDFIVPPDTILPNDFGNLSTTADVYAHTSADADRSAALDLEKAIYGDLFQVVPSFGTWNKNTTLN